MGACPRSVFSAEADISACFRCSAYRRPTTRSSPLSHEQRPREEPGFPFSHTTDWLPGAIAEALDAIAAPAA